jgi:hypothetical protein
VKVTVLVLSGCYNKMPQTVWLIQDTFISPSLGDWLKVQDESVTKFGS